MMVWLTVFQLYDDTKAIHFQWRRTLNFGLFSQVSDMLCCTIL